MAAINANVPEESVQPGLNEKASHPENAQQEATTSTAPSAPAPAHVVGQADQTPAAPTRPDSPNPTAQAAVPTHATAATAAATTTTTPAASLGQRLKEADRLWAWKVGIRSTLIVLAAVGIACSAWILCTPLVLENNRFSYIDFETEKSSASLSILILGVSLIWGINELLLRFLRQYPRPIRPPVILSFDLILWLAFGLPIFGCTLSLDRLSFYWPGNGSLTWRDRLYTGEYYLDHGSDTWVFNATSTRKSTTLSGNAVNVTRDCSTYYNTCAEQDAMLNADWHRQPARFAITGVIMAMLCTATVLHFVIFVWACVDTHAWRKQRKEDKLRATIYDMIVSGQIQPTQLQPQPAQMFQAPVQPLAQGVVAPPPAMISPMSNAGVLYGGPPPPLPPVSQGTRYA